MAAYKNFRVQYNVGKIKYLVSYHDGEKKYPDGSPFFDIKSFKKKKNLKEFMNQLSEDGYISC